MSSYTINVLEAKDFTLDLVSYFRDNSIVPIVGSGVSRNVVTRTGGEVPSGISYRNYMISELQKSTKLSVEDKTALSTYGFIDIAGIYEDDEFVTEDVRLSYFKKNFLYGFYKNDDIRKKFFEISWPYIYSLNIDDVIENSTSFNNIILPFREVRETAFLDNKCIIKIHGDIKEIVNYADHKKVFTRYEYANSILENKLLLAKLKNDLQNQNVIFVGCSLSDELDILSISGLPFKSDNVARLSRNIFCTTEYPNTFEKIKYKNYGITDVVVFSSFSAIYETIHHAWMKSSEISIDDLQTYRSFAQKTISTQEENQEYFFCGNKLLSSKDHTVFYPRFFVQRSVTDDIIRKFLQNKIHLISGKRISGRSYILADIYARIRDRTVYYFDATTRISNEIVNELIAQSNIIALFDIRSIEREQFEQIVNKSKEIHKNNNNFIICISKNDSDTFGIVKWKIAQGLIENEDILIHEISDKLDPVKEKTAISQINEAYAKVDIPKNVAGYTFLDHILYSENALGRSSRFAKKISVTSNIKELALLIVLAIDERLSTQDVIKFDFLKEIGEIIEKYSPMIEEENVHQFEKNAADFSRKKYVLSSRYWLVNQLGIYLRGGKDNLNNVVEAYEYIVGCICEYDGKTFLRRRNALRRYILFDVMNDIFMCQNGGPIRSFLEIYKGLHDFLAEDHQYLHQYAKCYARCADMNKDLKLLKKAEKYIRLALANLEQEIQSSNNNLKLRISKAHAQFTFAMILCDKYKWSRDFTATACEETINAIYEAVFSLQNEKKYSSLQDVLTAGSKLGKFIINNCTNDRFISSEMTRKQIEALLNEIRMNQA